MIRIFMVGYSSHKGGVETYIDNLCSKLNKDKYEVIYSMPKMIVDGKIWTKPQNRHNYIKYRLFWKRFFAENKFDVVYYNTCDIVSLDILKFAKSAGVPVRIIHSHNTNIQQKLSWFHKFAEKHNHKVLDNYANVFLACSNVAGKWMFNDRDFIEVKNGVSLDKFKYESQNSIKCRKKIGVKEELLIGFVGRISNQKNPFFAVKLIKQIIKREPSAKLVFVGDGELKNDVENLVSNEKLTDNVIFVGSVDNVSEWLSAFDCLIMPSLFEGLPFALVEAQANGLSCVASKGITKDADLTGLVRFVDLNDSVDTWVNVILDSCSNERIDTRQKLIENGYSIENTANEVMSIIESQLN